MPPPATLTGDLQRANCGPQIVAGDTSGNFRAGIKFGEGFEDCRFVYDLLTRAKAFAVEGEDADEIFLGLRAENDPPRLYGHTGSAVAARAFAPTVLR